MKTRTVAVKAALLVCMAAAAFCPASAQQRRRQTTSQTPVERPLVAIYMTDERPSNVGESEYREFVQELSKKISVMSAMNAVDKTAEIREMALAMKREYYEPSGVNNLITPIAQELGAMFLCVVNLEAVRPSGTFVVQARLFFPSGGADGSMFVSYGWVYSMLSDKDEIEWASHRVARELTHGIFQFGRALPQIRENDFDKSIAEVTKLIEANPDVADYLLMRARIYWRHRTLYRRQTVPIGRELNADTKDTTYHAKALLDVNEAIRINPNLIAAYNFRDEILGTRGGLRLSVMPSELYFITSGTISDFDNAIRWNPNNALHYLNRGITRFNNGDYTRAISDYETAQRLGADSAITAEYIRTASRARRQERNAKIVKFAKKTAQVGGTLAEMGVQVQDAQRQAYAQAAGIQEQQQQRERQSFEANMQANRGLSEEERQKRRNEFDRQQAQKRQELERREREALRKTEQMTKTFNQVSIAATAAPAVISSIGNLRQAEGTMGRLNAGADAMNALNDMANAFGYGSFNRDAANINQIIRLMNDANTGIYMLRNTTGLERFNVAVGLANTAGEGLDMAGVSGHHDALRRVNIGAEAVNTGAEVIGTGRELYQVLGSDRRGNMFFILNTGTQMVDEMLGKSKSVAKSVRETVK